MNSTKAKCGHYVVAIGAPGSIARMNCELHPCDSCLEEERAAMKELLSAHPAYGKKPISINACIANRAIAQKTKDRYETIYFRNYCQ